MTTITVPRALIEQALADNTDAQDFVVESIDHITGLYQGYDEMIERKTRYDRELLERMRKHAADLTAALAQPEPQGWRGIESAPKDGTEILLMYMHIETQIVHAGFWIEDMDGDERETGWWSYEHSEVSRIKLDDWMTPTHWMPLPDAPKENSNG